jgi:hypothetical protein
MVIACTCDGWHLLRCVTQGGTWNSVDQMLVSRSADVVNRPSAFLPKADDRLAL